MALAQFLTWLRWGYAHRAEIHYSQRRPIPHAAHLPLYLDCSSSVTLFSQLGGMPDPNGRGYDGEGFTGTMLAHLPHIPFGEVRAGDLCVFGAYPGEHVVAFMEHGPDPLVFSHGSEIGPLLLRLSAEGSVHGGQERTFLRFAGQSRGGPLAQLTDTQQHELLDRVVHVSAFIEGLLAAKENHAAPPQSQAYATLGYWAGQQLKKL